MNYEPIITAIILALVPVVLEAMTGIGRALVEYLKSRVHRAWVDKFIEDVEAIAASLQKRFVTKWKEAAKDGKITEAEKAELKAIFAEEVVKAVSAYPKYMTSYLKQMADHWLEEWLLRRAQNPRVPPVETDTEVLSPEDSELANSPAVGTEGNGK